MGVPDEHMQLGKSIYPAKRTILALVKDAGNTFLEKHALQRLPCVRGVQPIDPLSPVIVLGQAWRCGALADRTNTSNELGYSGHSRPGNSLTGDDLCAETHEVGFYLVCDPGYLRSSGSPEPVTGDHTLWR